MTRAAERPFPLRRNSLWLLAARLTAQALAVLFVALAARRLGVNDFGQFTVLAALILIGNSLTNFGTDTFLIREMARRRRIGRLAARALALQLALTAVWCGAIVLLRGSPTLLLYSLTLFPLAVFSVTTALLRGFERMDLFWSLSLVNGLVQVLAALAGRDLWTLCAALLAGQCITAAVALSVCTASLPGFRLLPLSGFRPILRPAATFAALTLLLVFAQRLGVLSVGWLIDDAATGLYSAAARVVDGLKLGHYAVLGALLPMLARDPAGSRPSFRAGFRWLTGISVFFALSLTFLARFLIPILYGQDFGAAAPLLARLGWSLLPYTVASFVSYDLIARGRERPLIRALAVSLLLSIAAYIGCISAFGLTGAVWGTLAGETLQAVALLSVAPRTALKSKRAPAESPNDEIAC